MSGHNKWSKISRQKGINDQKKGKIFSRIIREIMVSARIGGPDSGANPRLRSAIILARTNNMPKDVVERAIKKGSGNDKTVNFEELTYEGYGPGGTALMIRCLTDSRTRTVAEIRHVMLKYGGNPGTPGSASFLFDRKGIIEINKTDISDNKLIDIAIEAGAEDVTDEGDTFDVVTGPDHLEQVHHSIEKAGIPIISSEITMIPQNTVKLAKEQAESVMKLLENLEDIDDVQNVYCNFDIEE